MLESRVKETKDGECAALFFLFGTISVSSIPSLKLDPKLKRELKIVFLIENCVSEMIGGSS